MTNENELLTKMEALTDECSDRPTWDEYFMATAMLMSSRSACQRLRVGCVIVSGGQHQNRVVAAGYNGFLPGAPHTSRVRDGHEQAMYTPNKMLYPTLHVEASLWMGQRFTSRIFLVLIARRFWRHPAFGSLNTIKIIRMIRWL